MLDHVAPAALAENDPLGGSQLAQPAAASAGRRAARQRQRRRGDRDDPGRRSDVVHGAEGYCEGPGRSFTAARYWKVTV